MIELQCHFIPGSDATGCLVLLKSNCSGLPDLDDIRVSRNGTTATRQLSLLHNISCYRQVVAYTIDINNTISNLSIEGIVQPTVDNTQRGKLLQYMIIVIVIRISSLILIFRWYTKPSHCHHCPNSFLLANRSCYFHDGCLLYHLEENKFVKLTLLNIAYHVVFFSFRKNNRVS